jgi:hypothetical protein
LFAPLGAEPAVRTMVSMVSRLTGRGENMRTVRRRRMTSWKSRAACSALCAGL